MSLLVTLSLLVLALSILLVVPRKGTRGEKSRNAEDIDEEVLAEAEAELEGLRSSATPEDANDGLPDWGPGVPKLPRERADGA